MSFFSALSIYDKIKVVGTILIILGSIIFLSVRGCNQIKDNTENENIDIEEVDAPPPSEFDANCLRITGKPCPKPSK